jgi:hypothetical protein
MRQEIEKTLQELQKNATQLSLLLESYEEEISDICIKPLREMNVSEKIKLAKLLTFTPIQENKHAT